MSLNKVLFIIGPTSTGKTHLSLQLARTHQGDLISADSRQVYRGLDILTGKDIPPGFKQTSDGYSDGQTSIYGLDLVGPHGQWSAGHFYHYAQATISKIHSQGRLPIVVGGTGFYIEALLTGHLPPTAPPNDLFRKRLDQENLEYLQNQLRQVAPQRWSQMNHSDLNNKRRLIRALEVNFYNKLHGQRSKPEVLLSPEYDTLVIGLTAPLDQITTRIAKRVQDRLDQGVQQELATLQTATDKSNLQSYSTLGYEELDDFNQGNVTRDELIKLWTAKERRYAKRQLTWFKKRSGVYWYDITKTNYTDQIDAQVSGWYSQTQ